jgi:hypothetical protein
MVGQAVIIIIILRTISTVTRPLAGLGLKTITVIIVATIKLEVPRDRTGQAMD